MTKSNPTQKLIYIVEDDQFLAAHLARTLSHHQVEIFTNGVSAIQRIDSQLPDLLVLDIILDGPSGFSLLHELQSYSDTAAIPVIICSSIDLSDHDLAHYGVVAILDKTTMLPSDLSDLVDQVFASDVKNTTPLTTVQQPPISTQTELITDA